MFQRNARLLGLALAVLGCDDSSPEATPVPRVPNLAGTWQAVIQTPGGDLPLGLTLSSSDDGWTAKTEHASAPLVVDGHDLAMEFVPYDAFIHAELSKDGSRMSGRWHKTVPSGTSELPFHAKRGGPSGFGEVAPDLVPDAKSQAAVPDISGNWAVTLTNEGETAGRPAVGVFTQEGVAVQGTFLSPDADTRYLSGRYEKGVLRLGGFDGATVRLYVGKAYADGTLHGDFWSRDALHATWVAEPLSDRKVEDILSDPAKGVRVVNPTGKVHFLLPDLEGRPVSLQDERYAGRVVIVEIMGSWCPNCGDAAQLLSEWYDTYKSRGLEVVGLAFEYLDDVERNRRVLRQFKARHGIDFPLLLAGTSVGDVAASTLPDLSAITTYPTTLFVGRDGRVRHAHSGFSGPATGPRYAQMRKELEAELENLLAEPSPAL